MFSVAFLVTFLCSSILAPARNTNAETVTESSSASGYTLSLSATPVVNLNVGVLEVPVMTVGVGTVSTSTTAPNGYKLYLSMAGTSNDLRRTGSDVDTISATTGTMADSSALGIGEWGYAIPSTTPNISTTDFDTSYDIMESAYPSSKGFAAPPISAASAQLITSTSSANETENDEPVPDEVSIYYGVNADNTTELGTYTNSVLWTAVADAAQTAGATVSPTSASTAGGDTITVTSTLFSTSAIDANIYMLTSAAWQDVSANPSHISNYSSMQMSGCTQSSSTPVTYTGCVTPANDEGEGYHVYMDVPRYEKRYNADFTYENPTPLFYTISNMQDMTPAVCDSVNAPSSSNITTLATTASAYAAANPGSVVPSVSLVDVRGSEPYKSYTVRKLADGNCWMVDNLALENATLDSTNSNLPENKTVNLPASSTANWCTTNDAACDDQLMTLSYADAGDDASSHPEYGNYYNWYTATATYGTYDAATDTDYSICPKGWRLPSSNTSTSDFLYLYNAYSSYDAMVSNSGPQLVLSGRRSGSSTDSTGTYGYYWSRQSNSNASAVTLRLISTSSSVSVYPAITNSKYYGSAIRCIADINAGLTISPSAGSTAGGTAVTAASTYTGDSNTSASLYMLTEHQYADVATNPNHLSRYASSEMTCSRTSYDPVAYSCTTPANNKGSYYIYMHIPSADKYFSGRYKYAEERTLTINPNGGKWNSSTEVQTINSYDDRTGTISNAGSGPTFAITYNDNGQGATYESKNTGSRSFSGWVHSGGGEWNSTTSVYTFGDTNGTLTASYGSATLVLPEITKAGYFCQWAQGSASGTKYLGTQSVTISEPTTFYAVCKVAFNGINNMQQMTSNICNNATIGDTTTLADTRGSTPYKTYKVRKLADGHCWMVQNLALENATLNSSNSNLPSGKTVTLPASSTSGWSNNLSQSTWEKLLTINYADAGLTDSDYGNFYNWYTASATYGKFKGTQNVSYSICPKGWRLPTGGDNGEFQTLYGHYNSLSALRDSISGPGLLTTYHWWVSGTSNNGASYYSSTVGVGNNSYGHPYGLHFSYGRIYPTATVNGLDGASIRCIAN